MSKKIQEICTSLHFCIVQWETTVALVDAATEHLCNWSLNDPENNPNRIQAIDNKDRRREQLVVAVNAKLRHSYMASAKELQNMLSNKCKHFALYSS